MINQRTEMWDKIWGWAKSRAEVGLIGFLLFGLFNDIKSDIADLKNQNKETLSDVRSNTKSISDLQSWRGSIEQRFDTRDKYKLWNAAIYRPNIHEAILPKEIKIETE